MKETTSCDYVFWCCVTHKWSLNLLWHIPKRLTKIVLNMDGIRSEGSILANRQVILNIPLQEILEVALVTSATSVHGGVRITTREAKETLPQEYLLWLVNPFDPTLIFYNNLAEVHAFISIANALMTGNTPELDENAYIRQLKGKAVPTYVKEKRDFLWDKNVSPWVYYNEFVPDSMRKKAQFKARTYAIVTVGLLGSLILAAMYAVIQQIIR